MTYIKKVKQKSIEFDPLVRLITDVRRGKYGNSNHIMTTEQIKHEIKEKYNIDIGDRNVEKQYTTVDFHNEKNYIVFLLRWT